MTTMPDIDMIMIDVSFNKEMTLTFFTTRRQCKTDYSLNSPYKMMSITEFRYVSNKYIADIL